MEVRVLPLLPTGSTPLSQQTAASCIWMRVSGEQRVWMAAAASVAGVPCCATQACDSPEEPSVCQSHAPTPLSPYSRLLPCISMA